MVVQFKRWYAATAVYREPHIAAFLLFGFASGLPLALTGETLRLWLTRAGIDYGLIGLTSLVGIAYTIKFLWAPVVDHVRLGRFGKRFGRRRTWLISTQIAIGVSVFLLSRVNPAEDLQLVVLLALAVAFLSATQDIVVDAYRIERIEPSKLGAGTAMHTGGYMVALRFVGGAVALETAYLFGWPVAYAVMAMLMGVGVLAVLTNVEPAEQGRAELDARRREIDGFLAQRPGLKGAFGTFVGSFYLAVISPFLDMVRRQGWMLVPVLGLVVLFKFQDAFAQVMTGTFALGGLGFNEQDLAIAYKTVGFAALMSGIFVAGVMLKPLGLMRSLWIAGLLQMVSNFGFCWLAYVGRDIYWLAIVNGFENFASGIGNTIFVVFLSRLCSNAYTATQYALLSALAALARTFLAAPSGFLVNAVGWFSFFMISGLAAIPGLALVWYLSRSRFGAAMRAGEQRDAR